MENIKEKFKIDIQTIKSEQISVLKTIYREGEKHLKNYHNTMSAFVNPSLRVKCYDTRYYEEVVPIITGILREHELRRK